MHAPQRPQMTKEGPGRTKGQKFVSSPHELQPLFSNKLTINWSRIMNSNFRKLRETRVQNGAVPSAVVDISYWSAATASII